jgi:Ca2+:H+ antiporter
MPLMVVIGWGMGQPLSLNFHEFEAATLFAAVVIVSILIQKGQSTWLSGWMLVIAYLIIAAAFFVHKSDPESVIE